MIQNSFQLPIDDLKDNDIMKIMKMNEEEFIKEINQYQLPTCQKEESHSNNPIQFGLIKKIFDEKENILTDIQPACQACIENTNEKVVDLKELLIKTYHTANMQCDKNSFKECIDSTLILLQESFKKLQEVKERIDIYCEEVQEKIQTLQKKASFYPPIYVRDIITRIKDSIHMNQDEQNSTIASELKTLSQQVFFEEKLNMQPVIKGASLDVSMYYLLLHKIKSDTNIISQCLDIGCFILNDIDQCENIPHYADRLISNIKCQGNYPNSRNYPKFDKQFQEYKKKMEYVGLQDNQLNIDKAIDFHILYLYELYKFEGFKADSPKYDIQQVNKQERLKGDIQSEDYYKLIENKNQNNHLNNNLKYQQYQNQGGIFLLSNLFQQQQQLNIHNINHQNKNDQIKNPRRMRIFENYVQEKENKAAQSQSQFILKQNNDNSDQNK
ncbi:hypothetical protein ABPG74_010894 [Tetrahymena malaccensis]